MESAEDGRAPAWPATTGLQVNVGVLALQGAFAAHVERLRALGAAAAEVRTPGRAATVDALVMPGGESTTMSNLLGSTALFDPIAERIDGGMPVFGTCAGMILLADKILDGRDDQRHFGVLDITVRRNGYGRQVDSFEADLDARSASDVSRSTACSSARRASRRSGPMSRCSPSFDGDPVLVRQGRLLAACFHPELTDDARLHAAVP